MNSSRVAKTETVADPGSLGGYRLARLLAGRQRHRPNRLERPSDAISTFPTAASAVSVRPASRGLKTIAPYGLDDLFSLTVQPNWDAERRQRSPKQSAC